MASKQAGPGCLILFGLIFVLAGSVPGVLALRDLHTSRQAESWIETTARLEQVEMRHGDDTVSIEARYRYRAPDPASPEAGGTKEYEGTRVGISSGSDNVGDWQQRTCERLQAALRNEEPVPCWYDPADPSSAVLDRELRWGLFGFMMIFPLVFGLAGGGIMLVGLRQRRKARQPVPDPQVLANQELIRADSDGFALMWVMAIIWNAISWAAALGMSQQDDAPWWAWLLLALFPLIGLALLWSALGRTLRRLRHGVPQLRRTGGTWTTGSQVSACVLTRSHPQPGDRIEARVAVVRRVTTGSGDDERTSEQTQWGLDLMVDPAAGRAEGGQWVHPVAIPLPSDQPPTDDDLSWRLDWQVIRPGPDLSARFVLPVVAGTDGVELSSAALSQAADRAAPLAVLHKAGIRITEERGEVLISLPAWRNPGLHLTGLIATAGLTIAGAALWREVGWWTGLITLPILLLSWRGALRSALWRSRIALASGRIAIAAGWWRMVEHELKPSEVSEVERKTSMSSGDTAWYNMWLKTADGARIPIVRCVTGPAAVRLAEMIEAVRR